MDPSDWPPSDPDGLLTEQVVGRWFAPAAFPGRPDDAALGERLLRRSLRERAVDQRSDPRTDGSSDPVARYLVDLADGIAQARTADEFPDGSASALHLATGMVTAAAGLASRVDRTGDGSRIGSAADDLVVQAGLSGSSAAVDAALAGAGPVELARIAESALRRSPSPVADRLADLWSGLGAFTPEEPGGSGQTSCGGRVGENSGSAFLAEVTFRIDDAAVVESVRRALGPVAQVVQLWRRSGNTLFHVHTALPGPAVSLVMAHARPADLEIGRLD